MPGPGGAGSGGGGLLRGGSAPGGMPGLGGVCSRGGGVVCYSVTGMRDILCVQNKSK